jgi:hypothetical protein
MSHFSTWKTKWGMEEAAQVSITQILILHIGLNVCFHLIIGLSSAFLWWLVQHIFSNLDDKMELDVFCLADKSLPSPGLMLERVQCLHLSWFQTTLGILLSFTMAAGHGSAASTQIYSVQEIDRRCLSSWCNMYVKPYYMVKRHPYNQILDDWSILGFTINPHYNGLL